MKFSINTNTLRKKCTIEEIVKIALDAGVQGIEWGLGAIEDVEKETKLMRKATEDAGLEVVSYINGGKLWETDEIRRYSEAVAAGNGHILRVAHPWFACNYDESVHQPDSFMALVEMSREGLAKLMDLGKEYNIRYVLETHGGSCFASPLTVPWILKDFDPKYCGVIYDPANTIIEGFVRLRGAVELMGDYIAYIHAKNLVFVEKADENGKPVFTRQRRTVDQGMLDYVELMFALKMHNWHGFFSFEEFVTQDSSQVAEEVRNGIEHLKKCREAAHDAPCEPFVSFNR